MVEFYYRWSVGLLVVFFSFHLLFLEIFLRSAMRAEWQQGGSYLMADGAFFIECLSAMGARVYFLLLIAGMGMDNAFCEGTACPI